MSGAISLPPIPAFTRISANEQSYVSAFAASDPQTKSDAAYIASHAPKLTSPDALLKDYRSLSIVLGAFGISSYIADTALLKQLMTQDPTATTSTAYKLANPALSRFAAAMGQFTTSPFNSATNVNALLNAAATNNFETAQDTLSPGLADALYFKRNIGSITSIDQLMADPKLLQVAETATNMPSQFGTLDFSTQFKLISQQVKISDFSSQKFVQDFITKYLAMNQANTSTATDTTGALAILTGSGSSDNILSALLPQSSATSNDPILSLFA